MLGHNVGNPGRRREAEDRGWRGKGEKRKEGIEKKGGGARGCKGRGLIREPLLGECVLYISFMLNESSFTIIFQI